MIQYLSPNLLLTATISSMWWCRSTSSCKLLASSCFKHMDLLWARHLGTNVCPLDVSVVYHPPVSTKNSGTVTDFMTALETFFSEITLSVVPAVVVCDFNIHDPSKAYKLIDLLGTFGLIQHMTTPTHIHGHILDVVIRRAVDQSVASVRVKPMSIADHHCIDCVLAMSRPSMPPLMFLSETFVSCKFYISWTILPTSANSCPKGILKTLNRWLMIMTQFSERSLKDTPQARTG